MILTQATRPTLQFPFNGSNVDSVSQLSPTTTQGTQTYVSGLYGQAISFTGTLGESPPTSNIYYTITPNIPVSSGFSMSVWAYMPALASGASTSGQMLWALNNGGGNGFRCMYTFGSPTTHQWQMQYYAGGGSSTYVTYTGVLANKWYNLTNTMSSSGVHSFYMNGSLIGTSTVAGGSSGISGQNIYGATVGSGTQFEQFVGYIQDLRIYNTDLSPIQVQAIYANGGAPGVPSSTTLYRAQGLSSSMTGTPLLSQISVAPVGAFSLRAVGGVTAKAVNVVRYPVVQWPPVAMTSNTTVVSGQVYGNGTYVANASVSYISTWLIFDDNIYTYYENAAAFPYDNVTGTYIGSNATTISTVSVSGEWFQLELPTSIILRSYTLVGRQDNSWWARRNPTTFWIAGSNNLGGPWSNVHQQTNITPPQQGITINVPTTSNSLPYTYYRLVVNVIGSSISVEDYRNLVNLASWKLYGDAPYTTGSSDFYADRLGNLLTAPVTGINLATWLGGATGYVATWYDQSRAGNHATQATAANQPQINLTTSPYSLIFAGNGTTSGQSLQTPSVSFAPGAAGGKIGVEYIVGNNTGGCILASGSRKWWLAGTSGGNTPNESTQGNFPGTVGNGDGWSMCSTAITSSKTTVVYNSTASGSGQLYYINRTPQTTSSKAWNTNIDGSYPFVIGAMTAGGNFAYYSGNLYELIVTIPNFSTGDISLF